MPIATFVHDGRAIDYTPAADVAAGDVVVLGDLVGIAKLDIAANKLGALHVTGVYDVPKASGVGTGIGNGVTTYWDAATKQATTSPGSRPLLGSTVAAAGDAATTVQRCQRTGAWSPGFPAWYPSTNSNGYPR